MSSAMRRTRSHSIRRGGSVEVRRLARYIAPATVPSTRPRMNAVVRLTQVLQSQDQIGIILAWIFPGSAVILSEAKDLLRTSEILRFAQDDKTAPMSNAG